MSFEDIHRPLSAAGFRGAVRWIIIISGAFLVAQNFFNERLISVLGLTPVMVLRHHWWWQIVTYMFLHGGLFHWLFNMFILWMFGRELETRWGTTEFVRFYFICGIGAALSVLAVSPHSFSPTIGSSGAVFGLLIAFAMVFPNAVMYLYFVIPVKAWQAAALFAVIEFFAALEGGGNGLGRFAHLGGMLTGYLYLRYSWELSRRFSLPWRSWQNFSKRRTSEKKSAVELQEVTDDLVMEVDRILDKVLRQGVDSLTPAEKRMMDQYAKLKK
ncbi:MAG TPA: rhomboid family intramembrane serine protease [Elusimicrobiota bacterium]|nr:rhomboid family intramembrane serine protease [Elusimicrobiota bacterium]